MSRTCYHCGDEIIGKVIKQDDKEFCCTGCRSVYNLLSENNLGTFYDLEKEPGLKPKEANPHMYAFLDVESIRKKYILYEDEETAMVTLFLPHIHCSSCIYLLENLEKLNDGVISCQVKFAQKKASISFKKNEISLSELALLLDKIGYPPKFGDEKELKAKINKSFLYKLGLAGFAFGSIMLWTVPEYLGIETDNPEYRWLPSLLSFIVSLPVIFYSANEYFISAYKAIRSRSLNLDVPISIGIVALYTQSCYHIFNNDGPGYMDSFAGFVFFLLIGKWFQNKTYESLSFDRDYSSYFPIAVTRISGNKEEIVEIDKISVGDSILLRNEEIIPCDSTLISNDCTIDYSFVTGESQPIHKKKGDFIYAGGKVVGSKSIVKAEKETDRSHITQMWNESSTKTEEKDSTDKVSFYFLVGLLIIAGGSAISWYIIDPNRVLSIVVAVLIVACPCALALSRPFTFGSIMRQLGRKKLYLKNTGVVQKMTEIDTLVLDKTGTLTASSFDSVEFDGDTLTNAEIQEIVSITSNSTHPLSRSITKKLVRENRISEFEEPSSYTEIKGKGIEALINGKTIQLGSKELFPELGLPEEAETTVHLGINGKYKGKYKFNSNFRENIWSTLDTLSKHFEIHILSGDNNKDEDLINQNTSAVSTIVFNQKPQDKLDYIKKLQSKGKNVAMVGDGLNDSGALSAANIGIAVSEDMFNFTPNSDAIIAGEALSNLDKHFSLARYSQRVLSICYGFSIIYNLIGLSFAISGNLTPLIAAILMPISSISIVFLSTLLTRVKN